MVTSGPEKPTNHFQLHNENPLEDYRMVHYLIHPLFTVCELHQYPKTTFTVGRGDFCSLNSLSGFKKKKRNQGSERCNVCFTLDSACAAKA